MENSIRKGYENLATNVLKGFIHDWIRAIVFYDSEKDFNELRAFFEDEKYEIFCNICDINAEKWQNILETLKTKAFADKNFHSMLKEQWYNQEYNKDFYADLLMEQGEQG